MKKVLVFISIILLFVGLIVGSIVFSSELTIWKNEKYGTRIENSKTKVFQNTQSFRSAKKATISKYYQEFQRAETREEKVAIKNIIVIEFQDYDLDNLNSMQRKWLDEMLDYY